MQVAPEVGVEVAVSGVGVVVLVVVSGVGVVAASEVGVAAVVTSGVGVVAAGGEDSEEGVEKSLRLGFTKQICAPFNLVLQ